MKLISFGLIVILLLNSRLIDSGGPTENIDNIERQEFLEVIRELEETLAELQNNITKDEASIAKIIFESFELIDSSLHEFKDEPDFVKDLQ